MQLSCTIELCDRAGHTAMHHIFNTFVHTVMQHIFNTAVQPRDVIGHYTNRVLVQGACTPASTNPPCNNLCAGYLCHILIRPNYVPKQYSMYRETHIPLEHRGPPPLQLSNPPGNALCNTPIWSNYVPKQHPKYRAVHTVMTHIFNTSI